MVGFLNLGYEEEILLDCWNCYFINNIFVWIFVLGEKIKIMKCML